MKHLYPVLLMMKIEEEEDERGKKIFTHTRYSVFALFLFVPSGRLLMQMGNSKTTLQTINYHIFFCLFILSLFTFILSKKEKQKDTILLSFLYVCICVYFISLSLYDHFFFLFTLQDISSWL